MKEEMTAYAKLFKQKSDLTSIIHASFGKELTNSLSEDDLNSLLAFRHTLKAKALELEKQKETMGIDFVINVLMCKIVDEWITCNQLEE